jgi:hypothetical protein
VEEVPISFVWNPGMAPSQKKKNIAALHDAAAEKGLSPLLEVSSKSEWEVGQKLSAFFVKIDIDQQTTTLESVYQGSKVFERGGPYTDLFWVDSREAKRDPRLRESGQLKAYRYEGVDYPLSPPTAFYDWLYITALFRYRDWLAKRLKDFAGYTDIEFNPERSLNCQARSCATLIALERRGNLERAVDSFDVFRGLLQSASI